ncbi:DNA-packaging protein [Sphingomonas mucosissima]|uniref:Terminase-like family protein n=1 Tax=Sphingomonas mucosissima TaxID=370959 RepID=A0A245ZGP9_9SPHN|nr:terminase family protein [Sphingomonas mucosissima]OWK28921.1 terminase-like family protein [Sphingomonas mucosissima]
MSRDLLLELALLPPDERDRAIAKLSVPMKVEMAGRWHALAHTGQYWPEADWGVWLVRAGRGFGKTRAGAEWVNGVARRVPEARIALVGATADEARRVMVEGPSGVLATARLDARPAWAASKGEVRWPGGAIATVYSADSPEGLRGPEHHAAWCDELAKWRRGEAAWDNLMMTMRLGKQPQVMVTTTPRSTALMRRVMALPGLAQTTGRTGDNVHLPAAFVETMNESYGGTALGRQELDGELIETVAGALWTRAAIEACRIAAAPVLVRVVVGVDPPTGVGGDACGIVAAGLDAAGSGHVIEDASVTGATPEGWARAVAGCAARHGADRVVAEANQGGEMVRSVLHAADTGLPVRLVHASRGKVARAEPVAALYEAGRVRHAGVFPMLEDELCGLVVGGGYEGPGRSPDRADALVWALSELMLGRRTVAAVRAL